MVSRVSSVRLDICIIADIMQYYRERCKGTTMPVGTALATALKDFHFQLKVNGKIEFPHTEDSAQIYLDPNRRSVDLAMMDIRDELVEKLMGKPPEFDSVEDVEARDLVNSINFGGDLDGDA